MPSGTARILTRPGLGGRWAAVIYTVLLALALLPLASVALPPIVDYPNHLARMAILAAQGGDPLLARFYTIHWQALPNLAMDALLPPLTLMMPLLTAGRVFIALTFILFSASLVLLHRAAWGRWSWWGFLGFLLLYNRILLWGFLNYLFGLGLALGIVAIWLALDRRPVARLALAIPLTLAVFFSHLAAFMVLAVFLAGCELFPAVRELRSRSWKPLAIRIGSVAACCVLPVAVFVFWQPHAADSFISYSQFGRKADLLFSIFDNYHRPFDIACFAGFIALLIVCRITGRLHPRLGGAALLMGLAYLASPDRLFTASGADHRLPLALFAILIAAMNPQAIAPRLQRALAAGAAAMFLLRMGVIEQVWAKAGAIYREDLKVLALVPEGSHLAVSSPDGSIHVGPAPLIHFPVLAIPLNHAFVPTLFAYPAQQPVEFRPPYDRLAKATSAAQIWKALVEADPASRHWVAPLFRQYDDVIMFDDGPFTVPANPCLLRIGGSPAFQLFHIEHDTANCSW